ncbi:MAG: hypothetical protein LBC04_03065 [Holosporaceae bacterium]|nr:hypothetical protein [Holosporaceae bacterium]
MKETPLISNDLLKILVCPKSGGQLKLESDRLVCEESGTSYVIRDGIPLMLDDFS